MWKWLFGKPKILHVVSAIDDKGPLGFPVEFAKSVAAIYERKDASTTKDRTMSDGALEFLKRACDGKHRIVSSGDLTTIQIAEFQAAKLFYVEPGGGMGWALVPWELTTPKDRQREELYFKRKFASQANPLDEVLGGAVEP
jgi:hypothetical protein